MDGNFDGVFEKDYSDGLEEFKRKLPTHLGELLEDTIGWLAWDPKDVNPIGKGFYVWKKPKTMNCPACYVLIRIDEEKKQMVFCNFYDASKLDETEEE